MWETFFPVFTDTATSGRLGRPLRKWPALLSKRNILYTPRGTIVSPMILVLSLWTRLNSTWTILALGARLKLRREVTIHVFTLCNTVTLPRGPPVLKHLILTKLMILDLVVIRRTLQTLVVESVPYFFRPPEWKAHIRTSLPTTRPTLPNTLWTVPGSLMPLNVLICYLTTLARVLLSSSALSKTLLPEDLTIGIYMRGPFPFTTPFPT